jgi:integrase
MTKLTDLSVRNSKPKAARYERSDNGSGLWLAVQPSGAKSYATRLRLNGKPIKITHGDAGVLSLADARVLNAEAIKRAKKGVDPRAAKKQEKAQRQIAEANSFEAVALLYLDSKHVKKLRTAGQVHDRLTRLVFPILGDQPVAVIKRSQIVKALDRIEAERGSHMADRVLSDVRCVLNFYAHRDDDFRSPLVKGMGRTSKDERQRDRILTDDEIRALWSTGNRFAQFLLLTAARRDEVASMRWKEIDGNDWTLPASRNKTKVDLIRPLSKAAMDVLSARGHDDEFAFGAAPDKPFRGFDRLKIRLAAESGVKNWRFHDLRRTARSLMSRAGANADHAERCLGHAILGVRGVYDRHEFHAEKAFVFEQLAAQLQSITRPPNGNVLPLKKRKIRRA